MQPSPDERLRELLSPLPDLCRDIVAALERARLRGGGEVSVTLRVEPDGQLRGALPKWYERRGYTP